MKATVFLGGGRITGALAAGLRLAGDQRSIVVYDRHPEKVRALRRESAVEVARDLRSAVERAEMLMVAVRPGSVREMLAEVVECGALSGELRSGKAGAKGVGAVRLCISLAAGIPLRNLRDWMGAPVRWVRAMPSPVCRIGRGLTPVCFGRDVAKRDRARVRRLFEQVGPVIELREEQMDAITATHSPTHGYHALATLARAAEAAGLDRKTALMAAAHGLSDGIAYWRGSRQSLDELLAEAATPGGIAAATMAAMDRAGYGRVVSDGIRAGVRQARRNARR
ncbi:MAG TPA: NAD(P)-binding domain-containing protein [Terriglobales bacterium]|nr:NAD(P)-binding domain-containing protein [Terriglobales bacterium]